jgi:hypothetical protein
MCCQEDDADSLNNMNESAGKEETQRNVLIQKSRAPMDADEAKNMDAP